MDQYANLAPTPNVNPGPMISKEKVKSKVKNVQSKAPYSVTKPASLVDKNSRGTGIMKPSFKR
jgi:flagella basal body P-ring formation protein FlgA